MHFVPIVPTPWLSLLANRNFGFALAHLMTDKRYVDFYTSMSDLGNFVILDNAAYELPEPLSIEELWTLTEITRPSELVLPDVMKDRHGTLAMLEPALQYLESKKAHKKLPSIMIVPQATEAEGWLESALTMLETAQKYWPNAITVGVPRHTSSFQGGRRNLVHQLLLNRRGMFFNIHLLGVAETTEVIAQMAAQFGPYVRSFDSARPFVYAMNEIRINHHKNQYYPRRSVNYFDYRLQVKGPVRAAAFANIKLFDRISQNG